MAFSPVGLISPSGSVGDVETFPANGRFRAKLLPIGQSDLCFGQATRRLRCVGGKFPDRQILFTLHARALVR